MLIEDTEYRRATFNKLFSNKTKKGNVGENLKDTLYYCCRTVRIFEVKVKVRNESLTSCRITSFLWKFGYAR